MPVFDITQAPFMYILQSVWYTHRGTKHALPACIHYIFDMGLTQAEGQKLEWFKRRANNIFTITLKI